MSASNGSSSARRNLIFGTISFAICFAAWGLISAFAPAFRNELKLSAQSTAFLVAVPVLLGSLARIPMGLLTDRLGGRLVFTVLFLTVAAAAAIVPSADTYGELVAFAFFLGLAGSSFAVGVGFVSRWFPQERQGTALGVYGLGNIGHSAAVFLGPAMAAWIGRDAVFYGLAAVIAVWAVFFFAGARNAPGARRPASAGAMIAVAKDRLGSVWPGLGLLALMSAGMWMLNRRFFVARERVSERVTGGPLSQRAEQLRAGAWATMATGLLVAAIVVGSRNLQNFDPALVIYTFAVIFATWGIVYHYAVWLNKPPTRRFFERSIELLSAQGAIRAAGVIAMTFGTHVLGQTFIRKRSRVRWWMHQLLFWGCLTAVAMTFPLVFGWIHFGSRPDDQMMYITYLFGFPVASFPIRTVASWLLFHALDISAVLVLAGIALALWRRMRDRGALALQDFASDFLPLLLLFAISITGLALTASVTWLRGSFYGFLSILHAITVIGALLYLPFGKFFHIFQRPAQIGVKLYQDAGDRDEGAHCARCGRRYASRMQIDDLERVLPQLGFDYRLDGPAATWIGLCPECKRTSIASAQLRIKGGGRWLNRPFRKETWPRNTGRISITLHRAAGTKPPGARPTSW